MIKVLVAEDMQVGRAGLVALLDGEFGIEVVGRAPDARAAPDIAQRSEPDVARFATGRRRQPLPARHPR
ncbi:hypothetical protein ACFCZT_03215 [Streptomyces sp. NPDC056230]|uniref:hypothetical protein n=1 Tax=unclassified Streptomyces TaxID=2593676 RepID=UPI0035E21BC5